MVSIVLYTLRQALARRFVAAKILRTHIGLHRYGTELLRITAVEHRQSSLHNFWRCEFTLELYCSASEVTRRTCSCQKRVIAFDDKHINKVPARDETTQRAVSHSSCHIHVLHTDAKKTQMNINSKLYRFIC